MERSKCIRNGEKAGQIFSDAEYGRRQSALRDAMRAEGVDAALLTSIHNICYHSGFLYCSFGRLYGLVAAGDGITTVSANIDGGQPWRRTVGDNLVYTDWERDNYFRAVAGLIPDGCRVGIEHDHVSLQTLDKLKAALPKCTFKDLAPALMRRRMIKSAEEIEHIRQGAQICEVGAKALAGAVTEGVSEHEVALASTAAMVRETAERFPDSELMDTWTWFQSGINTDGAHNPVTTRKVRKGDILSLNCFSMAAGYYTALERTLFYGHVDDDSLRLWKANVEVHEAGLGLVRPGVKCCEIAVELNKIFESHGLLEYRTFGYGHSFGVLSHYYGREAGLELREDIETALEPGMVVSIEPMIMIPEDQPGAGGYREHDILVVTDSGAENLTSYPFGPENNVIF